MDSVDSEKALRPTVGVTGSSAMSVVVVEHGDVATLVLQIHFVPQDLKGFVRTHIGIGELWERQHKSERPVRMAGLFRVLK